LRVVIQIIIIYFPQNNLLHCAVQFDYCYKNTVLFVGSAAH